MSLTIVIAVHLVFGAVLGVAINSDTSEKIDVEKTQITQDIKNDKKTEQTK